MEWRFTEPRVLGSNDTEIPLGTWVRLSSLLQTSPKNYLKHSSNSYCLLTHSYIPSFILSILGCESIEHSCTYVPICVPEDHLAFVMNNFQLAGWCIQRDGVKRWGHGKFQGLWTRRKGSGSRKRKGPQMFPMLPWWLFSFSVCERKHVKVSKSLTELVKFLDHLCDPSQITQSCVIFPYL